MRPCYKHGDCRPGYECTPPYCTPKEPEVGIGNGVENKKEEPTEPLISETDNVVFIKQCNCYRPSPQQVEQFDGRPHVPSNSVPYKKMQNYLCSKVCYTYSIIMQTKKPLLNVTHKISIICECNKTHYFFRQRLVGVTIKMLLLTHTMRET